MTYTAVIEKTGNGYSAYLPDLPGCLALGETREETGVLIQEAVAHRLELFREGGDSIPESQATARLVVV